MRCSRVEACVGSSHLKLQGDIIRVALRVLRQMVSDERRVIFLPGVLAIL